MTITKIVELESRTNNISISEKTGRTRSIFHYVKSLRTTEGRVFRGNGIYFLAGNARDKTATFRRDFNPVSIPRAARPLTVSKQLEQAVVYIYIYTATTTNLSRASVRPLLPSTPGLVSSPSERKVFWY